MLLFLHFDSHPIVPFSMRQQRETVSLAFGFNGRNILRVEATHVEIPPRFHVGYIMTDVVQQDVPVDIGKDIIECPERCDLFGASQSHLYIIRMVEANVFERIAIRPFVDVDGNDPSGIPCRATPCR